MKFKIVGIFALNNTLELQFDNGSIWYFKAPQVVSTLKPGQYVRILSTTQMEVL